MHLQLLFTFCCLVARTTARLFMAAFIPPGNITSFSSYLITPPVSKNTLVPTGAQSIYTAVQPMVSSQVLQIPLVNRLGGADWHMTTTFCCDYDGAHWAVPTILVQNQDIAASPGTNLFTSQSLTTDGVNAWSVGWSGGAGSPIAPGQFYFPSTIKLLYGPFSRAIFALDIADSASWDFGAVTWMNVNIVVATNSTGTDWCIHPLVSSATYIATPKGNLTQGDGIQTCNIGNVTLALPPVHTGT